MPDSENAEYGSGVRRLLARACSRAVIPYLLVGLLLIVAVVVEGRVIEYHISAIESWILGLGPGGALAFIVLFAVATSLFVPETVPCVIAGALFGVAWGLMAALAGSLVAGAMQFTLSHELLRGRIQRVLAKKPLLATIQRAVSRDESRLQVLRRLTPLNPAPISCLLGATGMRFSGFLVACLALAPILFVEVYFGHVGRHAARLAGSDGRAVGLHDLLIVGGLAVCLAVTFCVSSMARKAVLQAVAEAGSARVKPGT